MKTLCTVLVCFLLISVLVKPRLSINIENLSSPLRYSTTQLKELRPPCLVRSSGVYVNNNGNHNNHRRGRRGGVRARIRRRPFKPFLPTVVIGNTRSLVLTKQNRRTEWQCAVFTPVSRGLNYLCYRDLAWYAQRRCTFTLA